MKGAILDGTFLAAGLFARLRRKRSDDDWEATVESEVERLTAARPPDVTIIVPAIQLELGHRLELLSRLMKGKGYRLRQVIPESGVTWAASFMRMDD